MSTFSRLLPALVLCTSFDCSHQMAISNKGFAWQAHLLNLRIGYKLVTAAGVQVEQGSEAMSEQMAEVLPVIVEKAVKAALICAGIGAAGQLASGACAVPAAVQPTLEELGRE